MQIQHRHRHIIVLLAFKQLVDGKLKNSEKKMKFRTEIQEGVGLEFMMNVKNFCI